MTNRRRRSKRLVIFVPEGRRAVSTLPIELYDPWVAHLLKLLARLFGGATAFGRGVGAWREGVSADSIVHFDRITVVESWVDPRDRKWQDKCRQVCDAISRMCRDLDELVVAWMVDGIFGEMRSE